MIYESNNEGEDDPMVSETITPHLGVKGVIKALIGSGCTRCLVNQQTVQKLGLRVRKLGHPMKFEQVDASIVGACPPPT